MKAGLLKALFLTIAINFAGVAFAGQSGNVVQPPSIPSGHLNQGYHPFGITIYSGYLRILPPEAVFTSEINLLSAPQPVSLPSQVVPEPTSAALAAIGFIVAARFRGVRRS